MSSLSFKLLFYFLLYSFQYTLAKSPQITATAKISRLLDDITDFFEDIISAVSDIFSFGGNNKNKKSSWSIKNLMKYATNTLKSGYKMIKDSLPVISIARESLESVSPHMPNVSMVTFVRHVLKTLTPQLIEGETKKQGMDY